MCRQVLLLMLLRDNGFHVARDDLGLVQVLFVAVLLAPLLLEAVFLLRMLVLLAL